MTHDPLDGWRGDPRPFDAQNPSTPTQPIDRPGDAPVGWLAMRHGDGRLLAVAPGTRELDALHREGGWVQVALPTRKAVP